MEIQIHQTANSPEIHIVPGFVWDAQDAYLFDIDGTLLRSRDRVHVDSFAASVQRITGFEVTLAGIVLHGSTDTAILREACHQAGIPPDVLESRTAAILICDEVDGITTMQDFPVSAQAYAKAWPKFPDEAVMNSFCGTLMTTL